MNLYESIKKNQITESEKHNYIVNFHYDAEGYSSDADPDQIAEAVVDTKEIEDFLTACNGIDKDFEPEWDGNTLHYHVFIESPKTLQEIEEIIDGFSNIDSVKLDEADYSEENAIKKLKAEIEDIANHIFLHEMKDNWTQKDIEFIKKLGAEIQVKIDELATFGVKAEYKLGEDIKYSDEQ